MEVQQRSRLHVTLKLLLVSLCISFALTWWYFYFNVKYFALYFKIFSKKNEYPNFILILTDDQDLTLHGMRPMPFTRRLFEDGGVSFKNAFASTPVCCPSRASLLTGRYQHNTGVTNNTVAGNCCGAAWRSQLEPCSIAAHLQRRGYSTFYAGKYLNQYGRPEAGGVSHVPLGWDWWVGLVGNSRYYNYTLSVNGTARRHGDNYTEDYLTDVIRRYALEFLRGRSAGGAPFFLMVAPPASHAPFTPAPQHARLFPEARVPRTASFNTPVQDKHRLLLEAPSPLPAALLDTLDGVFRDRWRTLVSVDNMVAALVTQLGEMDALQDTYLMFTSDHGYHLGQFSLTVDKRQPYEFDLRVPLYLRGGGVPAGRSVRAPVSSVDLAPTVLQLAGLPADPLMDGVSLMEAVTAESGAVSSESRTVSSESRTASPENGAVSSESGAVSSESGTVSPENGVVSSESGAVSSESGTVSSESGAVSSESRAVSPESGGGSAGPPPPATAPSPSPRTALLVSYNGEYNMAVDPACRFRGPNVSHCYEQFACKCQDSADNTYRCIREMSADVDRIVCRFTQPEFWEMYDLSSDPEQLVNIAPSLPAAEKDRWRRRLAAAERCSGAACRHI